MKGDRQIVTDILYMLGLTTTGHLIYITDSATSVRGLSRRAAALVRLTHL